MISDFVKGKKKFDYPEGIQKGIVLHRAIDTFTDGHEIIQLAKQYFRPEYRLYSGALVDVVFDHFLATDKDSFLKVSLFDFASSVYSTLEQYAQFFPPRFAVMFPYMKEQNWLYSYRLLLGAEKSIGGVVHRAAYISDPEPATDIFKLHYQPLQDLFRQFWPDLRSFALEQWIILNGKG
jgi:acyl carrier protein phosphodiesterase